MDHKERALDHAALISFPRWCDGCQETVGGYFTHRKLMQTRRLTILYRHTVYACMYTGRRDRWTYRSSLVFTQNENYLLALMLFKTWMTFFFQWKTKCVFLAICRYNENEWTVGLLSTKKRHKSTIKVTLMILNDHYKVYH